MSKTHISLLKNVVISLLKFCYLAVSDSDIIRFMIKKKDKSVNPGKVILPTGHPKRPEEHEVDTAWVLARHYRTTVEFLIPVDDYKRTSPDVLMNGVIWEIKSPKGKSRYTIQEQFKRASLS